MPRVQFTNTMRNISVTKGMVTPKRMGELRFWLKGAQAVIKEIPRQIAESEGMADRSIGSDGWFVVNTDVDAKWIKFNLENRIGEKAVILIDRKFQSMGGA